MRSWSSPSAESAQAGGGAGDPEMVRRFVEASRRAEIIATVNSARSEDKLAESVSQDLCEAFEAEVSFVAVAPAEGSGPALAGAVGLSSQQRQRLLLNSEVIEALDSAELRLDTGTSLLDIGARAVALMPFRGSTGERALVGVARLYGRPFDEAEAALLEAVGASTGHALERIWLGRDRDRHAAQQGALARAARALSASLELQQVLDALCREVAMAFEAPAALVHFGDPDEGLEVVAAHGVPPEAVGVRADEADGVSARAARAGSPQVSHEPIAAGEPPPGLEALANLRSRAAAPLRRSGEVDGSLAIGFTDVRTVTEGELELLAAFAELAGVACRNAVEHERAQKAASTDSLTGCLNHAALQTRLREEISRAERGGEPFSLVLLDLDDFKSVNEGFGHLSGDTVLRAVGEVLREAVRLHDQVARFGGDEFAMLLPGTREPEAGGVVERAIASIGTVELPTGEALGASAGIAEWERGEQATDLIERSDRTMRSEKRNRRGMFQRRGRRRGWRGSGAGEATGVSSQAAGPAGASSAPSQAVPGDQRLRRLATVAGIATKLARLLDPREIAETAVAELHDSLGYQLCALVRLREDGYVTAVAAETQARAWASTEIKADGAIGRCLRERRPVLVRDLRTEQGSSGATAAGMRSELAVPLYAGSQLWGAISLAAPQPAAFDEDDAQLAQSVADHVGAALRTAELYTKLEQTHWGTAEALAAALEARDGYTADHARALADLCVEVGRDLNLDDSALGDLRLGAIFHDIGKIAVPDAVLNKPDKLNEEEYEIIKLHPVTGDEILAPVPFLTGVRRIVRHDHERWDGTGYPDGLRGPQIPIGARIVFVVDAYHAMVSDRVYRKGMSDEAAVRELEANAGSQFDPQVVSSFLRVLQRRPDLNPRGA